MNRVIGLCLLAGVSGWLATSLAGADAVGRNDFERTLSVAELEPKLDGQEVTIKFTITGLDGIAQLTKEGQAPSFAIETESGEQKNKLSVWIEGELANVLDRLQMSAFQDNALKVGTVVVATGKLGVHQTIPNQYFLNVAKWQGFRILPLKQDK